jgi:hypothetical protein
MPGMPYTLEVGAILGALSDYCEDQPNVVGALRALRGGTPILALLTPPAIPKIPDPRLPSGPMITPAQHVDRDWFGNGVQPTPTHGTGWWVNWQGDAQGIATETITRALEVSLGLEHNEDLNNARRFWPITFLWSCVSPMFEGWVNWSTWQDSGGDDYGVVTVTFSTPGNGHPLYMAPWRPGRPSPPYPPALDDYADPPTLMNANGALNEYGMWVIGQDTLVVGPGVAAKAERPFSPVGNNFVPATVGGATYHGQGAVAVVAPAEIDGGVLDDGQSWS